MPLETGAPRNYTSEVDAGVMQQVQTIAKTNGGPSVDVESYYVKYGPMVLRRCRQLLRDEAQAKDAMQDVFVRVIENENTLEDKYPSSLLYTIATNVCISRIRSENVRRAEPEEVLDQIACSDNPERNVMVKKVLDYVFSMESEEHRESTRAMAVMHMVDGMSLEEVGKMVGMSAIGVRKRLKRFKNRVKGIEWK
jgi:RNA polymerase sigma-70 factor (ECF subfamily)